MKLTQFNRSYHKWLWDLMGYVGDWFTFFFLIPLMLCKQTSLFFIAIFDPWNARFFHFLSWALWYSVEPACLLISLYHRYLPVHFFLCAGRSTRFADFHWREDYFLYPLYTRWISYYLSSSQRFCGLPPLLHSSYPFHLMVSSTWHQFQWSCSFILI